MPQQSRLRVDVDRRPHLLGDALNRHILAVKLIIPVGEEIHTAGDCRAKRPVKQLERAEEQETLIQCIIHCTHRIGALMPSPFPGMDPYLEDPAFWEDFHRRFITYCADYLGDRLPDQYEARIDERLRVVEAPDAPRRDILPDVTVTRGPARASGSRSSSAAGPVATLEPVTIPAPVMTEVRDTWIEVLHRPERFLVTAIEVLSPTNKTGNGFGEYAYKRSAVLEQQASLVEIDLLIGGQRLELSRPLPRGDYYAYVTRASRRRNVDVYAWSLRDPLPTIPIPLKAPDPDIGLNLAEIFAHTFERGRYARSLRYDAAPPAPMSEETAAWARAQATRVTRS